MSSTSPRSSEPLKKYKIVIILHKNNNATKKGFIKCTFNLISIEKSKNWCREKNIFTINEKSKKKANIEYERTEVDLDELH